MQQEVLLALLAKEPSPGYQLRARLGRALGFLGEAMNAGHIYVQLGRLENGPGCAREATGAPDGPDRRVYERPRPAERVTEWLGEVGWPKPDLAEFHLKLIAAAAARIADPLSIIDGQRLELLRRLRDAQRAVMAQPARSDAWLLLEGIVLRLQADLRWLDACEGTWTERRSKR